jgi:hypothetical protein
VFFDMLNPSNPLTTEGGSGAFGVKVPTVAVDARDVWDWFLRDERFGDTGLDILLADGLQSGWVLSNTVSFLKKH